MIPVYITSFNRLTYIQGMLKELARFPEADPIVVDSASSCPKLLEYLHSLEKGAVIFLETNEGPHAPWRVLDQKAPYFVITDPDLDLSSCPNDTLEVLKHGLIQYPHIQKTGLSLRLDDVPLNFPEYSRLMAMEGGYYKSQRDGWWWNAPIDTTFAMYRQGRGHCYDPALRAPVPYQARHLPWYDWESEESKEYIRRLPRTHLGGLYWSTLMKDDHEGKWNMQSTEAK